MGGPACPPTDNAACKGIDDEGHVDEALPGRHVGEIGEPQHVRRGSKELPVHAVKRAWSGLVADRRADRLATDDALNPHCPHKPSDGAAGDVEALSLQLPPDLAHAIDLKVLIEHPAYLDLHGHVTTGAGRQATHVRALGNDLVVGGWGNRQQPADRLDPEHSTVFIDE